MRERTASLAALLAVVVLVGPACSGDGDDGGDAGGTADQTITIKDLAFDPIELTVSGSTTIEVVNEDTVEHSFTLDDDSVSQDVEGGESATVTIDPAASIGWHCVYHPDTMTGNITVS
jgi:plastocyanin